MLKGLASFFTYQSSWLYKQQLQDVKPPLCEQIIFSSRFNSQREKVYKVKDQNAESRFSGN